jgi:hypothetical protein
MATNLIYKGELNGTQVDFRTGSLTDISTFTGDVRGTAIQDSISNGVTDIGASQNAIYDMSGVLAALTNHVDITPGSDIAVTTNASGSVLNNITVDLDADGHVVATAVSSIDLDTIYYPKTEVNVLTGILDGRITTNDTELTTLRTATGDLDGRLVSNDTELSTLRTATGYLENQIDDLQAVSGVPTFDAVTDVNSVTTNDITVGDIRVGGGSITGPATITIDPDAAGASGKVIIAGDLQVDGTTTTINSTSVQIDDLSLVLGTGAPNAASADGGGIIIDGTGAANIAEFTFDGTNNRWKTNSIDIAADIVGNASTASKWSAATTLSLAGDLGGSVAFDGSDTTETLNATIATGAVENAMLAGSIANSKLSNSTVSLGGVSVALGGTDADPAFNLEHATGYPTTALVGTITNAQLAGSIANAKLDNSTISLGGVSIALGGTNADPAFDLSDATNYPTTALVGTITNTQLAGSIANSKLASDSVNFGGVTVALGSSDETPAFNLTHATNYPTTALVGTITNTQLAGSIANSKLSNSSITVTAGVGLVGGGTVALGNTTSITTSSDQGHLDEIELGSDNSAETNLVTKGGIIILRGTGAYGITTSGATDGNAMDLNDKTTVAFEGVVQSVRTDQDSDNGSHISMWKIQGAIRRDSDSTNMLQSFVTNTFQGSDAAASSSELSVSVNGNGLKINNAWSQTNLVTSATINYNWIEDAS